MARMKLTSFDHLNKFVFVCVDCHFAAQTMYTLWMFSLDFFPLKQIYNLRNSIESD